MEIAALEEATRELSGRPQFCDLWTGKQFISEVHIYRAGFHVRGSPANYDASGSIGPPASCESGCFNLVQQKHIRMARATNNMAKGTYEQPSYQFPSCFLLWLTDIPCGALQTRWHIHPLGSGTPQMASKCLFATTRPGSDSG